MRAVKHDERCHPAGHETVHAAAQPVSHFLQGHVGRKRLEHFVLQDQDFALAALFRHVLHDGDVVDPACLTHLHARNRQFTADRFAIGAAEFHLTRCADNAAYARLAVTVDIAVMLRTVRLWHKAADILSHDLCTRQAPYPLGCGIEEDDAVVLINHDHGINGLLHCGQQDIGAYLRLIHRKLQNVGTTRRTM